MSIWNELPKPIVALAPMEDVTDVAFRQIVEEVAPADLYFTEFMNVDAWDTRGWPNVSRRLKKRDEETKLIAQIWGSDLEKFTAVAQDLVKRGFAGIDINMGCPVKKVVARNQGGGMIRTPDVAAQVIAAVKAGAGDLPVSVKTRIGVNEIITEEWISHLLKQDLAALTIHARTVKEQSAVPAHWDQIALAVKLRDKLAPNTLILGNGDVEDRQHAEARCTETGADGVMIGRGIFHNIAAFAHEPTRLSPEESLRVAKRHFELYDEYKPSTPFGAFKKFFKVYVHGFDGAAELRTQLNQTRSKEEIRQILGTINS
jgi:tRNA-dihydrouridine synthase